MKTPVELLQRHFDTLFVDQPAWQLLVADDLLWELPYAYRIGHPPKLEGRAQASAFDGESIKMTEGFRFTDLNIHSLAEATGAVAEVRAEARIPKTGRNYSQSYVVFIGGTRRQHHWSPRVFQSR
jgi:ketosteroid isomerase-like protein